MSWMELSDDDRPSQTIWLDSEGLAEHFAAVRQRYKGDGGGSEAVPQAPLSQNELTKGLR